MIEAVGMNDEELESAEAGTSRERGVGSGPKRGSGRPFIKGQSGNPAGRPIRRATGAPGDRLPGADQPTRAVILNEAYSLVTVGEGDEAVEMPANVAVFRALTRAALKGSQIAQRRWTRMVREAELEQKEDQVAIFNTLERASVLDYEPSYEDDILVDKFSRGVIVRRMDGEGE
ncbi:hypothetical protein GCM10009087_27910 [Sphingomonas oligophenolica]|uniref:DUF5681 domain-containing protein n=1 Tax=Sphingomonas oligophenolica TaxID=301154 RepID=A0ABU9Y4K1_9SPHN